MSVCPLCTAKSFKGTQLNSEEEQSLRRERFLAQFQGPALPDWILDRNKSKYGDKLQMMDHTAPISCFFCRHSTIYTFKIILRLTISAEPSKRLCLNQPPLKVILLGRLQSIGDFNQQLFMPRQLIPQNSNSRNIFFQKSIYICIHFYLVRPL